MQSNDKNPKSDKEQQVYMDFMQKEIDTMEIVLVASAEKTAITIEEYISTRLKQGADPDVVEAALIKDLEEGGRIFGEFRNAIRATTTGVVNRARDNAIFANLGLDTPYRWVAVLINTCPDCLERHNRVQPWPLWELEGLPRTGATVCKHFCHCFLIPAFTTEIEPIQRGGK